MFRIYDMKIIADQLNIITLSFVLAVIMTRSAMSQPETIKLPGPATKGSFALEEAIYQRRSERNFLNKKLTLEQISQILWAAQGITGEINGVKVRTAPSAGALYPMEVYLLTDDGLYLYQPQDHSLKTLNNKDLRESLAVAAFGQQWVAEAPISLVLSAVHERITRKYGPRGERYSLIEAGHIAQNVHLQAVALGLGSVPIGAFSEEKVSDVLGLPENQEPLYLIPVGYPR